ncbi:MAG: hypothetical protein Q9219_006066 [cf. Caloplaca sp. 3 TL-2023]
MNDPGLDEPIQKESKNVEQEHKDEEDFQKEDEQAFLDPRSIKGTFGPMASAFSICALAENWRVIVPHGPGGNEAHGINVKDPGWYVNKYSGWQLVRGWKIFNGDRLLLGAITISCPYANKLL